MFQIQAWCQLPGVHTLASPTGSWPLSSLARFLNDFLLILYQFLKEFNENRRLRSPAQFLKDFLLILKAIQLENG